MNPGFHVGMADLPYNIRVEHTNSIMDFRQVLSLSRKKDYAIYKFFDNRIEPPPPEPPKPINAVAGYIESTPRASPPPKSRIPSVADLVCHLKLLRAFAVYKQSILDDEDGKAHEPNETKRWQIFVSNAARRFTIYISALREFSRKDFIQWHEGIDEELTFKNGMRKDRNFMSRMVAILPPLDIVMIWHAFLLAPRTIYDHFMRVQFFQFALFPMPLKLLSDAIDNDLFVYDPKNHFKQAYHVVVLSYTDNPRDLVYHIDHWEQYQQFMDIFCPVCHEILVENVQWSLDDRRGFADPGFASEINILYCGCNFNTKTITHDELRRRQMYADIKNPSTPLPGIFKYYSLIISHRNFHYRDAMNINDEAKQLLQPMADELLNKLLVEFIRDQELLPHGRKLNLLLRNYLYMNPIHCTFNNAQFTVWEDLVAMVMRQERFSQSVNELNWLELATIRTGLKELVIRYARFFSLLSRNDNENHLVPTLDIDLVWHTHQLLLYYYFEDCMHTQQGGVIDHDDKIELGKLNGGFEYTVKLYKQKFKEAYLLCFCPYCVVSRATTRSTILAKVRLKKNTDENKYSNHPLYLPKVGLTHISLHNAVEMPSLAALASRQAAKHKYGQDMVLPWEDTHVLYYGTDPTQFVMPPLTPFLADTIHLFGGGMCCAVSDFEVPL